MLFLYCLYRVARDSSIVIMGCVVCCCLSVLCYRALGGYGYCGEYNVERLWRDSKLLEIGGGTIEAHHKNMTRDLAGMGRLE